MLASEDPELIFLTPDSREEARLSLGKSSILPWPQLTRWLDGSTSKGAFMSIHSTVPTQTTKFINIFPASNSFACADCLRPSSV